MAQLVQSKCPGCKNLLRIPADWLHQPIRCKHCGLVLHAKQAAKPAGPPAQAPATPAPATRDTAPAVPLAAPVTAAPADSPFADLGASEGSTLRKHRRGKRPSVAPWWRGPVIALAVLITAGVIIALNWDRILSLLPSLPSQPVIADKGGNEDGANGPHAKKRDNKAAALPRRALVISVHDYLYANPIHDGMHTPNAHYLKTFIDQLSQGFRIPLNQIAHLSDQADRPWQPRAPTRAVIEKTLTNFLDSSRPQDRIMVFFIGHSAELGDEVYLAPIEGELDNAATLIPLKWVYEKLAQCKARQKVLVLDVNRYNATFGQERPGSGEMGPKLDAMLKEPPAGVQVWSACGPKQKSYETDDNPMGVFLDSFQVSLAETQRSGRLNKIQKPEDPLPVEQYVEWVNEQMKQELELRKLEQVSRLTGKETDAEGTLDKNAPPPPDAAQCLAPAPKEAAANKALIESVLAQIGTPPVKVTHEMALRYDALPPFPAGVMEKYKSDKPNPDSPLRKAVAKARATLWALYPGQEPSDLRNQVEPIRQKVRVRLSVLQEGYRAPNGGNAEKRFKEQVYKDGQEVALLLGAVEDALEEMRKPEVVEAKNGESKRWKANYDFMLARLEMEHAYLYEYDSMLGQMRKEFPPLDRALHGGWRLASQPELNGDAKGKRSAKNAQKILDKIIKDHAGTPWEVLAKREKLTNLGLEWQAAR